MRRRWNPLSRQTRWSNHQNSSTELITTDTKGHFEISSACNIICFYWADKFEVCGACSMAWSSGLKVILFN